MSEAIAIEGLSLATEDGRGTIRISGAVDLQNAPELFDEIGLWATAQQVDDFVVDLGDLERASSVMLAMLIELTEMVRVWRGKVLIREGGDDLRDLAAFYGVQELLSFAEEPAA